MALRALGRRLLRGGAEKLGEKGVELVGAVGELAEVLEMSSHRRRHLLLEELQAPLRRTSGAAVSASSIVERAEGESRHAAEDTS